MRLLYTALFAGLLSAEISTAGTFNSAAATGNWNTAAAWTLVAGTDADGIPDLDDDVVILSGHNISATANANGKSLTINSGGTYTGNNQNLFLRGNFTNNGTATGVGFYYTNATSIISSSTPLTITKFLAGVSTITLAAGTQMTCITNATSFNMSNSCTFNNNGTLTLYTIYNGATTGTPVFNNLSGSSLVLNSNITTTPVVMNSSTNSLITLNKGITSIPNWTYCNLTLAGSVSSKAAAANLTATGNIIINSGVTMNLGLFNLILGGNLTNSGTISNIGDVTFNGTTTQTIASPQTNSIATMTSTNPTTIVLSTGTYDISNSVTIAKNLTLNSGVVLNMNSHAFTLGGNLSNSGSITNTAVVLFNGTANQTIASPQTHAITTLTSTNTSTIILSTGTYNIGTSASFTGSLTINAAAVFNLNSHSFTIGGNLANSGTISNPAAVTFNGTTAQTISFTNNLSFTDITSSNSMGVSITTGTHNISNSLTVTAGNLNVGAQKITLLSDAVKTAYIGNSAGTISGSLIIQKYISARPTNFHDFSSSVTSTTIDDWDDELYMSIGAPDNTSGYAGGDGSSAGVNSVYIFDPSADDYTAVLTGTVLQVGRGYDIYLGDDPSTFPGRAIDTRGTPNMGSVVLPTSYVAASPDAGWNLVGNPHAASIQWTNVVAASTQTDATISMLDNSGNYVNYTAPIEIPPGQGFFCYINNATGVVNVPQSAKTTTTATNFYRTAGTKVHDLKLRLSSGNSPYYHEIEVIYDKKGTAGYEKGKDIPFFKSKVAAAPSITFVDNGYRFTRNYIPADEETIVLPLEIRTPVAGNYLVELEGLFSTENYTSAFLVNNATKETTEINDSKSATIYFESDKPHTEYTLVLSKKKSADEAVVISNENVSIFATSENVVVKSGLSETKNVTVELYNSIGQVVSSTRETLSANGSVLVPTTSLEPNVYIVKVFTADGKAYTKKIVVSH